MHTHCIACHALPRRHLYLLSLTLQSAGDVFHCEKCIHLLLRNVTGGRFGGPVTDRLYASAGKDLSSVTD